MRIKPEGLFSSRSLNEKYGVPDRSMMPSITPYGSVVSALEAGDLEGDQVRMTCGELCSPHLMIVAGGVAVLPDVADIQRMRNQASAHLLPEKTVEQILVERQGALREDGITARAPPGFASGRSRGANQLHCPYSRGDR